MSILRKVIVSLLCFSLFTLQLSTPLVEYQNQTSREVNLGFNDAKATNLGFTKISEAGFPMGYIQLLVMLGIGLMSISMIQNAKRLSPDSVMFVIGGLLYLTSVIISWMNDKVFDELGEIDPTNQQKNALLKQKKLLELALNALEKRLVFVAASTAAFASSAIMAASIYMKEKLASKKVKFGLGKAKKEAMTVCQRDPALATAMSQGGTFVTGGMPVAAACTKWSMKVNKGLLKCDKEFLKEIRNNEVTRSSAGSVAMYKRHANHLSKCAMAYADLGIPPKPIKPNQTMVFNLNEKQSEELLSKGFLKIPVPGSKNLFYSLFVSEVHAQETSAEIAREWVDTSTGYGANRGEYMDYVKDTSNANARKMGKRNLKSQAKKYLPTLEMNLIKLSCLVRIGIIGKTVLNLKLSMQTFRPKSRNHLLRQPWLRWPGNVESK